MKYSEKEQNEIINYLQPLLTKDNLTIINPSSMANKDGDLVFTVEIKKEAIANFDNSLWEVARVNYSANSCALILKISVSYIELAVWGNK